MLLLAALLAGCGGSLNDAAPSAAADAGAPFGSIETTAVNTTAGRASAGGPVGEARAHVAQTAGGLVTASTPGGAAYRIGPHDVLEISVFRVPELSRAVQVGDTGTVGLPLVGEVQVAGRTAREFEADLARMLKERYLQNPQVTVFVKEFNSQRITIEGAVKKTGVYPLRGRTTLLQALSLAEGLDPSADNSIAVLRQTDKGRTGARFDLSAIRAGTAEDPPVQAGDVIVVGASFWKEQFGNFTKLLPLVGVFALL